MSRIRSRDTKPEVLVRSILHRLGYRFRKVGRKLPGNPDVILPKRHAAVFVHGCFWHRHRSCKFAYLPKTRVPFWSAKFEANQRRDLEVRRILLRAGWHVIVVWECQLKHPDRVAKKLMRALEGH
jgi:DNA mismatch endonuclease (patch repair protein)